MDLDRAKRSRRRLCIDAVSTLVAVGAAALCGGVPAMAAEVSRQARAALAAGGVRSAAGRRAIDDMDRGLRDARHTANPGTAADLTAAAIFVALLGGGWPDSRDARATGGGRDAATR